MFFCFGKIEIACDSVNSLVNEQLLLNKQYYRLMNVAGALHAGDCFGAYVDSNASGTYCTVAL